ncbi:MAG TPA: glycosyltransferase family 2 protein [Verrucomicrobiae bacterium]
MNPLVTIGLPTYKRFAYLQEAVAAALAQTYAPIEVLISDDGPGTEIGPWSRSLAEQDPRVRYQKNAHNLGLAGNWNAVVEAARGEWLVLMGDDDRLCPDFLEKLVPLGQPDVSVVFANHYLIDEDGHRLLEASRQHTIDYSRDQIPAGRLVNKECWVWRNALPMCSAIVRTEDARKLRFKADLNTPEIEFFLRLACAGGGFVFHPEYLMEYRTHSQSATTAGLWGERLADYLLPLPVSAEAEPWKRQFMNGLLPGAVTRALLLGESGRARKYLDSPYYPDKGAGGAARCTQRLCAWLPGGCTLYRMLFSLRHKVLARPPVPRVS